MSGLTMFHFFCAMCEVSMLCHEDGPSLLMDKQLCWSFQSRPLHCFSGLSCSWLLPLHHHPHHVHVSWAVQVAHVERYLNYSLFPRTWYLHHGTGKEPQVILTAWTLPTALFGLGLSIGVVIAVGILLIAQLRAILRNQTWIEDWIRDKCDYRHRNKGSLRLTILR